MEIKYGNDKTEELKKKGILRKEGSLKDRNIKPEHKMIKQTPMVMNEAMFYHTFMKGWGHC